MQSTSETTFGKSVRLAREAKRLTQTQLAKLVGTSQQNIAGIEAGRSLPKDDLFDKLVEVFGRHSAVAQLPPRGVIKLGYDVVEDVKIKSATTPVSAHAPTQDRRASAKLSPQAQELGELFDMLPADKLTRASVHRECTGLILEKIDPAATVSSLPAAQLAYKP